MILKVTQAAEVAGVSRERIYAAIRQGWLKPVEGVPYVCLHSEDVEAFRQRNKPKGGRGKRAIVAAEAPAEDKTKSRQSLKL